MKNLVLMLLVAFSITSCYNTSAKRANKEYAEAAKQDSIDKPLFEPKMIQVIHEDGRVENIKDDLNIRPSIGDTLVLINSYFQIDSTGYSSRSVYGKYVGRMPENYNEDSSYAIYQMVRVIKTIL